MPPYRCYDGRFLALIEGGDLCEVSVLLTQAPTVLHNVIHRLVRHTPQGDTFKTRSILSTGYYETGIPRTCLSSPNLVRMCISIYYVKMIGVIIVLKDTELICFVQRAGSNDKSVLLFASFLSNQSSSLPQKDKKGYGTIEEDIIHIPGG